MSPSPITEIITEETVQFRLRNLYSTKIINNYKLTFNRNPNDIVKLLPVPKSLPTSWQNEDLSDGVKIIRKGVKLTIIPAFEGVSVSYYDKKPEIVKLGTIKISRKPIYRIKDQNSVGYSYVTDYSEDCKQWQPLPTACHISNFYSEKAKGLEIFCKANTSTVIICDDILKSIDIIVTKL
ncbi:MAG: hypothetical protein N2482_01375 [Patescibacteria group bacterium]|nr:hypothetical protein [Patescibacteria group bacterium]